jgi:predicted DCC family thiol-disulfide oxidoreductase YuxK
MRNLFKSVHDAIFAALTPERMGLLRIATGLFSLWYLLIRFEMIVKMAGGNADMYEPTGLAKLLSNPMPQDTFSVLLGVCIGLGVTYTLGWKFKYTGPAFALLFFFVMCYRNSWSMIYHNYNGLVLQVLVLGLTRAADAFSLDARRNVGITARHWRYGWPVFAICLATTLTYLLSGLAKVMGELTWEWVSGFTLRSQVAVDALRKTVLGGGEATQMFQWLYDHTWVFLVMGIVTLVVELGAPLALLHRRMAYAWVLLTLSMHWGIWFIMDISFPYQLTGVMFLPFLPLEDWYHRIRRKKQTSTQDEASKSSPNEAVASVVLFDGDCLFCQGTVQFILQRDPTGRFHFASLQSAKGKALCTAAGVEADLSTLVLIEAGRAYLHSNAVLRIAKRLQAPWPMLYVFWLVPRFLRDAAYRYFAKHRYQWFGRREQSFCELPNPALRPRFLDINSL